MLGSEGNQVSLGRRFAEENDPGILHKLRSLRLRVWPGKKQQLADENPGSSGLSFIRLWDLWRLWGP